MGSVFEDADEAMRGLEQTADKLTAIVIAQNNTLSTEGQRRCIEYFWDNKKKEIRTSLPENIIVFFANENMDTASQYRTLGYVQTDMGQLVNKGYVIKEATAKEIIYRLTQAGTLYVRDKHPKFAAEFDSFLERTPVLIKLLVGLIGLIASVLGIIEFVSKFFK